MGVLSVFRGKKETKKPDTAKEISLNQIYSNEYELLKMNGYMLADVRRDEIIKDSLKLSLSDFSKISPITVPITNNIKRIINSSKQSSEKLFRITNLGKNDSLKLMRDGNTFWGAIKKSNGKSSLAKLKEVKTDNLVALDPTVMLMSVALAGIESELGQIKEFSKKIFNFIEYEKQSEIESDLEILNRFIAEFRFNIGDEKYLINNHKQVMEIKRTANKNILFYKKGINDSISKNRIITTDNSMKNMVEEVKKKLMYYRLSLYTYSFSELIEVLLVGNYSSEYLSTKIEELNMLNSEYDNTFEKTLSFIKNNADKSLEGNVIYSLGTAGKAMGNFAEKIKVKNVDVWLNQKGDSLKQTGENIKDNYALEFSEMKDSNSELFVRQIEKIDGIYNRTKEIYFDQDNIYLDID